MNSTVELKHSFSLSIPTMFAYFPMGVIFSVLWLKAGFAWFWAPIFSVFVYAGAVQYITLSLMQLHASLTAIALAVCFVAFRNVFYGIGLVERYKTKPLILRSFLIFGLVDASFGTIITNPENEKYNDSAFCFYSTFFPFIYWVLGTISGLTIYKWMPPLEGLEFIQASFFMILVVDSYLINKDKLSLIMPIIFAGISYMIFPAQYLILSILFSVIFIHFSESSQKERVEDTL